MAMRRWGAGRGKARGDALAERVCAVVVRTLSPPPELGPIGPETVLYGAGLGLDSIAALELVAALEEEFDITIGDAELSPASFERVGSLVALVRKLKGGS
jgi:acyl carrier protein